MTEEAHGVYEKGIFRKGGVRISDLSGRRVLPVGNSNFTTCVENAIFIDKSLLIADVIDSGAAATLYCRPRRFGKSLNLDMLHRFFELPSPSDPSGIDTTHLFEGLAIWDAKGGSYRAHHQAYPVVRFSFGNVKDRTWEESVAMVAANMGAEYLRHGYLAESERLSSAERDYFERITNGQADETDVKRSLAVLSQMLYKHHDRRVVVLIDEYDAPVMAGYTHRYYNEIVSFLKSWLVGTLKDNDALAFAVLTGVQRISKESIFSDLNNLRVNTSLNVASDERYGFTQKEVEALAEHRGAGASVDELRAWYDGFRFGSVDVYNPWSVLNYFSNDCAVDIYWGNTSSNSVLGDLVRGADDRTLAKLYGLLEPGGVVREVLDLGVVFPDIGLRKGAVWSMLYLAGYLTTNDTEAPNDTERVRALFIPNYEIAKLYRSEIIQRFSDIVGDRDSLVCFHEAMRNGDDVRVQEELERILLESASFFDLTRENSYHMLLLGLLFGMRGYGNPLSNREAGRGRFDLCVSPDNADLDPLIVVELKCAGKGADDALLANAAEEALEQIEGRAYAVPCNTGVAGVRRFGIAFSGKRVAVKVA